MTLLQINLVDVLSESSPDDCVIIWSPELRAGPNGSVVNTRRKEIWLTNGVGEDEVIPGRMNVQISCKGVRDTSVREVDVPDQVSVTLAELLWPSVVPGV